MIKVFPTLASMHMCSMDKKHEQCASEWQWYWHVRGLSFVKKEKRRNTWLYGTTIDTLKKNTELKKNREKVSTWLLRMCSCASAYCSVAFLHPDGARNIAHFQ